MAADLSTSVVTRLSPRNWLDIRSSWINYFPSHQFQVPRPFQPIDGLASYPPFAAPSRLAASAAPAAHTYRDSKVRGIVLEETLFQIHKAAHILCCTSVLVNSGKRTWPIAQTYQSSFYSLMAFFGLLGLALPEIDVPKKNGGLARKSVVVDTMPSAGLSTTPYDLVDLLVIDRVPHLPRWVLFKHLIARTTNRPWSNNLSTQVGNLADDDFEDQRNRLHYDAEQWFFDDLVADLQTPTDFGRVDTGISHFLAYSKSNRSNDFGIRLAVVLLDLCVSMLRDMAKSTNLLNDDLNSLDSQLADANRHTIFANSVL